MSDNKQILVITDQQADSCVLPESLCKAIDQLSLDSSFCRPDEAMERLGKGNKIAAAIVALEDNSGSEEIKMLTEELRRLSINMMLVPANEATGETLWPKSSEDGVFQMARGESVEMIKGRLAMLLDMHSHFGHLTSEIDRLKAMGGPLDSHFRQVSEEMQLAARLQRDFLPKGHPELPGIRFATVYRPASWVSGDIYDIARLDEDHIGFYVADAVGHGMPAALLTMFIKRAVVTKKISGHSYSLVEPCEVVGQLNNDMVNQGLSDFQFATCCYSILNFRTLKLRVANAGHPMPMRFDRDGRSEELDVSGTLLGVFEDQKYKTREFQLKPGDKLLIYSDGVELAFVNNGPDEPLRFRSEFEYLANCDIETMCEKLVEIIENEQGSLHPRDDVTIVALESAAYTNNS